MKVTIVYNEPEYSRYTETNEQEAVTGVLTEVNAVEEALIGTGYTVERIGLSFEQNTKQRLNEVETDLFFNLFEGFAGKPDTEPEIADLLEKTGIPVTGCPGSALRLALDKHAFKEVLLQAEVPYPASVLLGKGRNAPIDLRFPCIVKPNGEDASHGLSMNSVVHDLISLSTQIQEFFDTYEYSEVMVEEFIDGREFNATVMGNDDIFLTATSEIVFTLPEDMPKIITYAGKWHEDSIDYKGTTAACPADLTAQQQNAIDDIVKKAYRAAGCKGYARIDLRMDETGAVYVLEVNPNPDISPGSGAALQAKNAGMDYTTFIVKIVDLALERYA